MPNTQELEGTFKDNKITKQYFGMGISYQDIILGLNQISLKISSF